MRNRQSAITAGAVFFAIIVSSLVADEMKLAGLPLWLRIAVAAALGGVLAGLAAYAARRIVRN